MRVLVPLALSLALLAVGLAPAGHAPAPSAPATRTVVLEAVAYSCALVPDGVCLGYGGAAPGPLLDVDEGDLVVLTLVNRIPDTVWALDASGEVKARLANASVSFHVHGTALPATEDGVAAHAGTRLVESVAPPGGSFTYHLRAAFPGAWHYHDHVLGADGSEGIARGLYGTLLVGPAGHARPDAVLDLHLLDGGANGGAGMDASLAAGSDFEVAVVGLGDWVWDVTLKAPGGAVLRTLRLGPGESETVRVDGAVPGTYRWTAKNLLTTHQGQVVVS